MKKTIFILSLLLSFAVNAQQQSSLLWEISGNGLEQPSYIFGTIHMIPKKSFFFTDKMEDYFKSCKNLVLEVDISALTMQDKINMAKGMFFESGTSLKTLMDSIQYKNYLVYLRDTLKIKEKKIERYNKIKPFYSMALIMNDYYKKITAYEMELVKYAKKNKMSTEGLETMEYQLSLVDSISLHDQLELFLDIESIKEYEALLDIYLKQDLEKMYEYSVTDYDSEMEKAFMDDFVDKRNENWALLLPEIISNNPSFIAVGALHLPGEKGVLKLLENQGYKITPVSTN